MNFFRTRPFFRSVKFKVILGIVLLLVIIRLILPYVILHFANERLAKIDGYYGHIEDIDLAIIRGAYVINDIYIDKVDSVSHKRTPFISSESIDLSIEWKALFKGRIVGELTFDHPKLRFTKDKVEPEQVAGDTTDFRQLLKSFMPLSINRFEIIQGDIIYEDHTSNPKVDLHALHVWVLATNLSNVTTEEKLPSTVKAKAEIYRGTLDFNMKLNALAEELTFDMNATWKDTYLPDLNDFFKAYANFDVEKGTFGLYTEVAAADGNFVGYVKPIIKDLKVKGPEDKNDEFINKFWESVVGTSGKILTNWKKDQVATKIPLEGSFKGANVGVWSAVFNLLRNAFVRALQPSIDNEINLTAIAGEGEGIKLDKKAEKSERKKEKEKSKEKEK